MIRRTLAFIVSAGIALAVLNIAAKTPQATAPTFAAGFPHSVGDPSIDSFWVKFKLAVANSDKSGVATMSQFPIEMPYGVPAIRNRRQLIRRYRELFSVQADARKCFTEAQPVIEPNNRNRFTVGCKDVAGNEVVVYGFVRTRTGWKLKSLDNINE